MMLLDVRPDHFQAVREILRRLVPDREVWAFGSRAKWTARDTSDLDLCIVGDTPLGFKRLGQLRDAFSESRLPYKVDVVDWATTSESFRKIIGRDKVVVQKAAMRSGMAAEWTECKLVDACSSVDYGFTASATNHEVGPRFLQITDIVSGHIDWKTVPHVAADEETIAKYQLHDGDIVLARTGASTGASAYVKDPPSAMFASYLVRLQVKPEFDPRFLAYFLKSDTFWTFIRGVLGDKSAQPNASAWTMTQAPLRAPRDRNEQRAIAHILGTLDDKIELNRRMNETLEAMARELFKSWFVNFDPVRAKAEGRDPGLPMPLAELFPACLVDSEVGEIPEGWEVGRVGNVGNVICGKTPPTQVSEYYGDDLPFITIPDMHGKIFATATQKRLSHAGAASQQKKMLPAGAICVSCIATPGLVVITSEPAQTNQQINTVVPSRSDEAYFWFWALRGLGDKIRAGGSGGSVLTNLSTGRFAQLNVLSPPSGIRSSYHLLVAPAFARILESERESRTLATLRDTLLPKLISGELRVKHAEKRIEEAV